MDTIYIEKLTDFAPYPFVLDAPDTFNVREGVLYSGNPDFPNVGDVRIRFEVILPREVSVIGQQIGTYVRPYLDTDTMLDVALITPGSQSIAQMGMTKVRESGVLRWFIRLISW